MQKPKPQKNAECHQCCELKPLLMPFGFVPGWPIVEWEQLCLKCRTSQQCSKHWNRYGLPAYIFEHGRNPDVRKAYFEWLENSLEAESLATSDYTM